MDANMLTRRELLARGAATAVALAATGALAADAAPDTAKPNPEGAVMAPLTVQWLGGWLSWVAATTACLRALGVDCDPVEVAGISGYAFVLNSDAIVDVSSPTAFDWSLLTTGVQLLGRSTQEFCAHDAPNGEGADARGECARAGPGGPAWYSPTTGRGHDCYRALLRIHSLRHPMSAAKSAS